MAALHIGQQLGPQFVVLFTDLTVLDIICLCVCNVSLTPSHFAKQSLLRCLYPDDAKILRVTRSPVKSSPDHPPNVPGEQKSKHDSQVHNKSIEEKDWS